MSLKLNVVLLVLALAGAGALALLEAGPKPSQFDTVYVDDQGNCQGNTPCVNNITAALAIVNRSGLILIYGGTYNEALNVDIPVTIRGESRDLVTVDAGWSASKVIGVGNQDVTLEELTLVNADYGIEARSASGLTVRNARITDTYGGILGVNLQGFTLEGSHISGAQAYDGVEIDDSSFVTIGGSGNNVSDNIGRGIFIQRGREVVIRDNLIRGNGLTGLNVSESVNVTVANNTIEDNANIIPILTRGSPGPAPASDGDSGGLRFWLTDPTAVEYNVVTGNGGFGLEISGAASTDYMLLGNDISGNFGNGLMINLGASNVVVDGGMIQGNANWGVLGEQAMGVRVMNAMISANGPSPIRTRSENSGPVPLQDGGGLRFWLTDPSEIRGSTITSNRGPAIELEQTMDFDLIDNTIEIGASGIGTLLMDANRTTISGNHIRSADAGMGNGTVLVSS